MTSLQSGLGTASILGFFLGADFACFLADLASAFRVRLGVQTGTTSMSLSSSAPVEKPVRALVQHVEQRVADSYFSSVAFAPSSPLASLIVILGPRSLQHSET